MRGRRAAARGRARRRRRARTSWSTGPTAGCQSYVETGACPPAVRRPLLPAALGAPSPPPTPTSRRGGTMVVDRGTAVLHPRRVAALRRPGLDADQHDRRPRGGARPRAAACATPRSRWSPTWTPASRRGDGRRPGGGVRAVPRRTSSGCTGLLADTDRGAARPGRLHLLDLGRRHRAHLRGSAVRVLLTGSAGFIGAAVGAAARGGRPRGGPGRPDARRGARLDRGRRRAPTSSTSATPAAWADLLDGVDVVCHQAAVVGAGRHGRRPAGVRRPQRPRHRRAAGRDARGRASTGWCWPPRWSSTARAATPAPSTATRCRRRGARPRSTPATSRTTARSAARPLDWALVDEDARLDPRSVVRRQQGRPGALRLCLGAPGRRAGGRAALPQRLRARACRGTRRTPASRRCSAPPSSAASRRRSSRTAARCATSCTSTTWPGPTSPRCGPCGDGGAGCVRRLQRRAPATRSGSSTWPTLVARGTGRGIAPEVTGGYRLGDVRHIVASPARAARRARLHAPRSRPRGAARVRHRAAARLSGARRSPGRVEQVLDHQRR